MNHSAAEYSRAIFRSGTRISLLLFVFLWLSSFLSARIAIYSDTQLNDEVHQDIITEIAARKPDIAFLNGDLTSKGQTQTQFDNWRSISEPLSSICRIYPAKGNHERDKALFLQNFPYLEGNTWYTVDHDSLTCIVLDTTSDLKPGSEQYSWLRGVLAGLTKPALLFMHHPVFSSGMHGDELGLSLFLPDLLTHSRVIAVFSGHDHSYERSVFDGVTYVVTGGGGGTLREAARENPYRVCFNMVHHYLIADELADRLDLFVYSLTGELIDSFSLPYNK